MDRNALAELLQALESRRDAEERRREERYTALIERPGLRILVPQGFTPAAQGFQRDSGRIPEGLQEDSRGILEGFLVSECSVGSEEAGVSCSRLARQTLDSQVGPQAKESWGSWEKAWDLPSQTHSS
ncbi:UNVERIFIED_CONTAM: hypothetical protein FKN15_004919 [Acipenser sinensis]